ncbi:restriction endonuclease subunit S [Methanosarcina sp.]|uniref:restriction endonuclease subunit S n=1 Tax=Methanosarcina sp. TaxID=2213 RepID=UPI0029892BB2|nr:restriction endonuclease subunit S [Methanosarcina sp.]MDW5551642.1 restriction endonuclease subunit S [Methanosarcina sp.]MDW5555549.1 restriction endonuclease subunit S [Methanosarcina sp.]
MRAIHMYIPVNRSFQIKKLQDIVTIRKKGLSSYYLQGNDVKVPMINIKDIQEGKISPKTVDYVSVRKTDILDKSRVLTGDVVISIRGSSFKVAVVDNSSSNFVISSNLIALTLSNEIIPEFLAAYFESSEGQSKLQSLAAGATIKGLSLRSLLEIEIPIPSLEIQKNLSQYLSLLNEYKQISKEELELRYKIKDAVFTQCLGDINP